MSVILDSRDEMLQVDPSNALSSIEQMASQVQQVWELAQALSIPDSYATVRNVVVAGMGGSAYGTHVIQTLYKDSLRVPVTVVPDYAMPAYVNAETLVIASSYSGSSEETLAAVEDAHAKGAKIIGLTTGGKLGAFLTEHQYPVLQFDPIYNPCGVARFGYAYSIFGQIALCSKLGLIPCSEKDVTAILETIAAGHLAWSADVKQEENQAKLLAYECHGRIPVVTVAEHLEGVAHVVANAFNENAKTYSEYRVVPELNHHLLEGFEFPDQADDTLLFLTVNSDKYEAANRHRMQLTEELMEKFHLQYRAVSVSGETKLQEVFSLLVLGVYVSYYLSILHDRNPAGTPQVDWFKAELKKR